MTRNIKWKISLSNGETLHEEKGDYVTIPNELSPYLRLLKHVEDNSLEITSISLYSDSGKTFNLPSAGKRPRFAEFQELTKPLKYSFFRKVGQDVTGDNAVQELFAVIEAQYENYTLQLWVDDASFNCWVLVKEI